MSAQPAGPHWLSRAGAAVAPAPALANVAARRPTRLQIGLWAAFMAGCLALSLRGYTAIEIGAMKDDAAYILLARSLALGGPYAVNASTDELTTSKYPFVYPLVLAPLVALFPNDLSVLRWPSLVFTLANGALLFWGWAWFSRRRSYWWALAVTGLYLWSPLTVGHTRVVMSEPVFTLFCLALLFLVERCARTRPSLGAGLGMGLALAGAVYSRSVGWLLLPVAVGELWAAFGRRALAAAAGLLAGLALVTMVTAAATSFDLQALPRFVSAYLSSLASKSLAGNARTHTNQDLPLATWWAMRLDAHITQDLRGLIVPVGGGQNEAAFFARLGLPSPMPAMAYLLAAVIGLGLARWLLVERLSANWLFTVACALVLAAWLWRGQRLLYPIAPQLYFGLLLGLEAAGRWAAARWRAGRWLAWPGWLAGPVALLAAGFVIASLRVSDSRLHLGSLSDRTAWLRANAPPASRVLTYEPLIDALYGGGLTIPAPKSVLTPDRFERLITSTAPRYILIGPHVDWQQNYSPAYREESRALRQHLRDWQAAGRVRLVYTSADGWTEIYEVITP